METEEIKQEKMEVQESTEETKVDEAVESAELTVVADTENVPVLVEEDVCQVNPVNPVILAPVSSSTHMKDEYFWVDEDKIISEATPEEYHAPFVAAVKEEYQTSFEEPANFEKAESAEAFEAAEEEPAKESNTDFADLSLDEIDQLTTELEKVAVLVDKGIITQEDFELKKASLIKSYKEKAKARANNSTSYFGNQYAQQNQYQQNQQSQYQQTQYQQAKPQVDIANDIPSGGMKLLCFLIPLVGLILFITEKDKHPNCSQEYGKMALIGFIIGFVSLIIIYAVGFGALYSMF